MRLLKSTSLLIIITIAALTSVHQKVELVKLSYAIDTKETRLNELLDRMKRIRYNILNLEDPSRLEKILVAKKIDISFPKREHIYNARLTAPSANVRESLRRVNLERKGNFAGMLEFFGLRAEAHARER